MYFPVIVPHVDVYRNTHIRVYTVATEQAAFWKHALGMRDQARIWT